MPMIYMTKEEFDAFFFFMCETEGNAEGADDDLYLRDVKEAGKQFRKLREKFHNATHKEQVNKILKKMRKEQRTKEILDKHGLGNQK